MLIVVFPADTVIYLPRKFENLGGEMEKHCIFYSNKMFFNDLNYSFNCDGVSVIGQSFTELCWNAPYSNHKAI